MDWSVLTVAALTNGLNPCGIGLSVMFLSYLLVFGKVKRLGWLGIVYLGSVLVTYILLGLIFYNLTYFLQRTFVAQYIFRVMGGVLIVVALIQAKDIFWPDSLIHFKTPDWVGKKVLFWAEKASLPLAAVMGVVVTAVGTPCMMPLYVGMVTVLVSMGLSPVELMVRFLYYNLVLILPMIGVFVLISGGKRVTMIKEWEHRYGKWMKLAMSFLMGGVGIWLLGK
jgi:hypothetical protein